MNKEHIPVIPLRGLAVLPDAIIHFDLKREKSIHAVEYAMMGDGLVFLASQKDPECQDPGIGDLYTAGKIRFGTAGHEASEPDAADSRRRCEACDADCNSGSK